MNNIKRKKLIPSYGYIAKLENSVFPDVIDAILAPFAQESIDITGSLTAEALAEVQAQMQKMKHLQLLQKSHPLTASINKLAKERRKGLISFVQSIEAARYSVNEGWKEASIIASDWLAPYRRKYGRQKIGFLSTVITFYKSNYDEDEVLRDALSTLKLTAQLEYLASTTTEIREMITIRNRDNKDLYSKASETRELIYDGVKTVLITLVGEAKLDKSEEGKFKSLYNEVAQVLKYHRSTSQRKSNVNEEFDDSFDSESGDEGGKNETDVTDNDSNEL